MKESTKKLLNEISQAHDWTIGQVYSGGGTEYHSTDICHVCGLRRHYKSDHQNGIKEHYRFTYSESGEDVPILRVLERGCA